MNQKIIKEAERLISNILDDGIQSNNLDYLSKLVDIRKDAKEDECMRYMNYGNYSNYGRDSYGRRSRDARGRYTGHRPEDKIDEMYMNYQAYYEGKDEHRRNGNYGAKEDSMKCLEYMLDCMLDFAKMLKQDVDTPEEQQIIQQYFRQISEI